MALNNRIKRLYIMPEVWETVTESQVFNWIRMINGSGIHTDCLSITSEKLSAEKVAKIEASNSGRFFQIRKRMMFIKDFFLILFLLKFYFSNVFKYEKIIFQTRLDVGFTYFLIRFLPKLKVVFEARGASNEENNLRNKGKKRNFVFRAKRFYAVWSERLVITRSHMVFCVSKALKKYYADKYDIEGSNFYVFPGAADAALFYLDKQDRSDIRQELNVTSDDIVVVYSGRLAKKWEIPDKIISFFKSLHNKNQKFKLLLLTTDVELAHELIEKFEISEAAWVRKGELEEVNKYLNAADIGLLLREDIPMNQVASPTKFAEYLMAGLPVVISKGVHDFAEIIDETKYGVVVDGLDAIAEEEFVSLERSLNCDKEEISTWGKQHLSKEVFIQENINLLKRV